MSSQTLRIVGIVCLVAAVVLFILNLKRVADAGTFFVALPLGFIGIVLLARSKKRP
ncbi:MAG TPA: hypothetical protein VK651_01220 [Blastocatellia bacterium]|nr:hypothetical protein [Blastocatellia bacterium]